MLNYNSPQSAFAEAISSLNLEEKRQLQEIIEQQIFEALEALYSDDAETQAEIQAVRASSLQLENMRLWMNILLNV